MPIKELPTFKSVPDKMLEIPQPAVGGVNLKDLEFEQEINQSPYMLNVMYRNGAFGKRFGQEVHSTYGDKVYSGIEYRGDLIVHAGKKIYKYDPDVNVEIASGMPEAKGLFILYAQILYYLTTDGFYSYDGTTWSSITPYVPDFIINCKPDGSDGGDVIDDLNVIGSYFNLVYNGDGTSTTYHTAEYNDDDIIDWTLDENNLVDMKVEVDDEEWTQVASSATLATKQYKVNSDHEVVFYSAPSDDDLNVVMTFKLKATVLADVKAKIYSCKYYDTFGGSNNSRLFLAGAGNSMYYWSASYDISYFPENNWAKVGNTEEDITGFGRQYNVLIVFKPKEVYSVYAYTETSSTTVVEENIGMENFKSQLVNARIGCDAPHSIQLINNLLTWFNSKEGICTLVSTNIVDERNVRLISRNIERTNNFGIQGILDIDEDPANISSADYNNKYFLCFPTSGYCFMWDYEIVPYRYSSSGSETNPRQLDWFVFDHFYVKQFIKFNKALVYISEHEDFDEDIIKLNSSFYDLDFDGDGNNDAIHSYYMTPFIQFNSVEMLKNVKNSYVQTRGDTATAIEMYYYTDDSIAPEPEPEDIRIGGKIWKHFQFTNFQWMMIAWASTFRRKCNLKKIQMASFYFQNDEAGRDMSITHIGLQYQYVKYVR